MLACTTFPLMPAIAVANDRALLCLFPTPLGHVTPAAGAPSAPKSCSPCLAMPLMIEGGTPRRDTASCRTPRSAPPHTRMQHTHAAQHSQVRVAHPTAQARLSLGQPRRCASVVHRTHVCMPCGHADCGGRPCSGSAACCVLHGAHQTAPALVSVLLTQLPPPLRTCSLVALFDLPSFVPGGCVVFAFDLRWIGLGVESPCRRWCARSRAVVPGTCTLACVLVVAHTPAWMRHQRPHSHSEAPLLQVQAWLAILTNCVVFAFSSDQVIEYFPELFQTLRLPRGGVDKVRAAPTPPPPHNPTYSPSSKAGGVCHRCRAARVPVHPRHAAGFVRTCMDCMHTMYAQFTIPSSGDPMSSC